MLYTSKDLLYIVLAFCILWLTIFFSWILYYIAMILRDTYRIFGDMKQRIEAVDKFIHVLTEKLEHTSSYLALLVDGFGRLVTFLQEKKGKKKRGD
ncbi:hypothetical protein A3H10_03295 [Candidatus Uhrbacteria bacterium RIFCSPLOWO2_12_FULL_46_10]|uniref:Uncharacterized protein n=1 Tax=Candidatus Uhrbacteria bacterium RIFCSPLOWO2_01_FULL_47_25 TaxID=1802402 RepID=A0A1F7UWW2_9BACT|nr:MAG: hypothetical protein UX68_C0014G0019 [Parcubacteria group bacterium GW2011_GWA2_46_9]OGL59869.1 MAG: hypothetical protein A2752_03950 [Candidatus Uhrbacteria bacterium RIFCSPHIGHO2_01_FULL_46_23]OGL70032.1 MAG: hypothetical protein A3D60_05115 [Candidatus Uhrbacteria bacterium RIFCSPHIGHO2_02_FULL_47_29]OGL76620.1 MAG: hypothetical protein A3E96_00540 [Candidatus Uhrbacteria bacterium RIFCSPHIGHO2_12_FULL_46_13]OGL82781.1 MAG: hypothetical protein A2936_05605 [Candidatus Uhrbacteria bac